MDTSTRDANAHPNQLELGRAGVFALVSSEVVNTLTGPKSTSTRIEFRVANVDSGWRDTHPANIIFVLAHCTSTNGANRVTSYLGSYDRFRGSESLLRPNCTEWSG